MIIEQTPSAPWSLGLRIPDWCTTARLRVAGEDQQVTPRDGRVTVERAWSPGDGVELELEMPIRMTVPSPHIDSIRGCVAIERGPVVYCMEDADLPAGVRLADVSLRTGVPARLLPGPEIPAGGSCHRGDRQPPEPGRRQPVAVALPGTRGPGVTNRP